MGTHPIFESDFDCLTDRTRDEMGIKNLMKLIQDECPGAVKETVMKNYFGRKIALDASMCLYQFLIAVRQDGNQLTNEAGEVTSHLNGLFYRTIRMVEAGLKPVYVFDGKPPQMKSHELQKRKEMRAKAADDLEEAKETGTAADIDKQERRLVKVTKEHVIECKRLLTCMGIPFVEAETEAEAQCAQMILAGLVHHVATEDMDALTFKTTNVLRRLTMPEARKLSVQELSYEKVIKMLDLTHEQFVDLCILLGCDYVPSIKGIGPKKAMELIRQHKSLEAIIESLKGSKYEVPIDWQYEGARQLFLDPEVHHDVPAPKWTAPNVEDCVEFLANEKGFAEDRVRNALKRMDKAKGKTNQGRMDDFFKFTKVASTKTPKKAEKRKAGGKGGKGNAAKKPKKEVKKEAK